MLKKNSSERVICCRCRESEAVQGFAKVPVCARCKASEERNLSSVSATGDIHGESRSEHHQRSGQSRGR